MNTLSSSNNGSYTFSFWAKGKHTTAIGNNYFFDSSAGDRILISLGFSNTDDYTGFYDSENAWHNFSGQYISDVTFEHYTIVLDGDAGVSMLYVNGSNVANSTYQNSTFSGDVFVGCNNGGDSQYINATIDEFGIWNRTLNQSEIQRLYDMALDGNGYGDLGGSYITMSIISPSNNSGTTLTILDFLVNVTVSDSLISILNVSFFLNGILNETNTSTTEGVYNFTKSLSAGSYNWSIIIYDNLSNSYTSGFYFFNITEIGDSPPSLSSPPVSGDLVSGSDWSGIDFDLTNNSDQNVWTVNDSNFTINSTGYLNDVPTLGIGVYVLNITVNDSAGQEDSTIYTLTVSSPSSGVGWKSFLEDGLISWYSFDETSGTTAEDSHGSNNGTAQNSAIFSTSVAGIVNTGADFSQDYCIDMNTLSSSNNGSYTFSFWAKGKHEIAGNKNNYFFDSSGGNRILVTLGMDTTGNYTGFYDSENSWHNFTGQYISNVTLEHYTIVMDGDAGQSRFYVNGSNVANSTYQNSTFSGDVFVGCNNGGSLHYINATIDEFGIWNRTLNQSEIQRLYDMALDGNGYGDEGGSSISISVISPSNNSETTLNTLDFLVNITGSDSYISILNVSFFLNGVLNETNTSTTVGVYNFTKSLSAGSYNWSIITYDNLSNSYTSGTYFFTLSQESPTISTLVASSIGNDYALLNGNLTNLGDYSEINVSFQYRTGLGVDSLYDDVDFDLTGNHKTELHTHTAVRPGITIHPDDAITTYQGLGFTALALTDLESNQFTYPWENLSDLGAYGDIDPDAVGMLDIPGQEVRYFGNATDQGHHVIQYFTEYETAHTSTNWNKYLDNVNDSGGFVHLAHPHWHFRNGFGFDLDWYKLHFQNHTVIRGLEIFNRNTESNLTRYNMDLWDDLIVHFGSDRPVYGLGVDDQNNVESQRAMGYVVVLNNDLNRTTFRDALNNGRYLWAMQLNKSKEMPNVTNITHNNYYINVSISGTYDNVQWWFNKSNIANGTSIDLSTLDDETYVRFEIHSGEDVYNENVLGSQPIYLTSSSWSNTTIQEINETGNFSFNLTSLSSGSQYDYRSMGVYDGGIIYGDIQSFNTLSSDDNLPSITLNFPPGGVSVSTDYMYINCSATDDINLVNVSVYLDGILNQTNSSGLNNSVYIFNLTGLTIGEHNWTCEAYDNSSQSYKPDVRSFTVLGDDTSPSIILNSPANSYSTTLTSILFNCSATDDINLTSVDLIINSKINETNSTGLNNTDYLFNVTNLAVGSYTWTCQATDNSSQEYNASTRSFTITSEDDGGGGGGGGGGGTYDDDEEEENITVINEIINANYIDLDEINLIYNKNWCFYSENIVQIYVYDKNGLLIDTNITIEMDDIIYEKELTRESEGEYKLYIEIPKQDINTTDITFIFEEGGKIIKETRTINIGVCKDNLYNIKIASDFIKKYWILLSILFIIFLIIIFILLAIKGTR
jgi:hypothetical protein